MEACQASNTATDPTFEPLCAQIELFERAAAYFGWPRERLIALQEAEELFFRLFPYQYRALQTIRIASQLSKGAGDHPDPAVRCESRLLSIVTCVINEAIEEGDLKLRGEEQGGELAFTIWALAFGTRALMDTRVATRQLGIRDGFELNRRTTALLLDAIGWRPLQSEWDYTRTRQRIREQLFASEWERIRRSSDA
jgi:hypothetical protein